MVRGELHGGNQSPDPPLAEVEVAEQIRISPLIENVDDRVLQWTPSAVVNPSAPKPPTLLVAARPMRRRLPGPNNPEDREMLDWSSCPLRSPCRRSPSFEG